MPTASQRPDSDITTDWNVNGGSTHHEVLADESDATDITTDVLGDVDRHGYTAPPSKLGLTGDLTLKIRAASANTDDEITARLYIGGIQKGSDKSWVAGTLPGAYTFTDSAWTGFTRTQMNSLQVEYEKTDGTKNSTVYRSEVSYPYTTAMIPLFVERGKLLLAQEDDET